MKWQQIDGWWGASNANVYKKAINQIPDGGTFIEIGCWLGRSSCCAAELIKKSKKNIKFKNLKKNVIFKKEMEKSLWRRTNF